MASGKLPDLVITDWKMPRTDGLSLCRMLRQRHSSSSLLVILFSGDPPSADNRWLSTTHTFASPSPSKH